MGDNPPCNELFADRTRPPLEVVHDMKLLGLIIDSSLSFKAHVKSIWNKVNTKIAALRRVRKFIPSEVMVYIYKAFILPHLEYCAPVLVGLTPGLSNKLELNNKYANRSLMNMPKLTSYRELLNHVDLRFWSIVDILMLLLFFTNACTISGRLISIKEMFIFRNYEHDLRGFNKLHQHTYNGSFIHR